MLDYLQAEMGDTVIPVNENLVYYVLNACRALAFLEKYELLSKQEGGEWGDSVFPGRIYLLVEGRIDGVRRRLCGEECRLSYAGVLVGS